MPILKFVNLFILLLLTFQVKAADSEIELSPEHFSHTAEINLTKPESAAAAVALPQWVFLASKHQLRDVRVFNGEGLEVAHQLLPLQQAGKFREFEVAAVPIPVEAKVEEVLGRNAEVKVDVAGKVDIRLNQAPLAPSAVSQAKINQWVIDDPKLAEVALANFRFELADAGKFDFSADLSIDTSSDLRIWQTLTANQKILNYGKQRLALLGISIPAAKARYWRVKSNGEDIGRIAKIYVTAVPKMVGVDEMLTIDCELNAGKDMVVCPFKAGQLPVTAVRFDFGKQRVALNGQIDAYEKLPVFDSSPAKDQPRPLQSVRAILTSTQPADIALNGSKITAVVLTAQQGGKLGLKAAPNAIVSWPAKQLKFLVNGGSPFLLAAGADNLNSNSEQPLETVQEISGGSLAQPSVKQPKAFVNPSEQKRPWLLWSVLGLAVISLGWMAVSLLKQK